MDKKEKLFKAIWEANGAGGESIRALCERYFILGWDNAKFSPPKE